jgi:hypothetical protein
MILVNREDLAWAAGLFDGEGHTRCDGGSLKLSVAQKDREVLDRFVSAVGVGKVYGPYATASKDCLMHNVLVSGANAQAAIAMLWAFLGTVKRQQAADSLSNAKWRTPGVCTNGHNKKKYGVNAHGACMECKRVRDRVRHVPKTSRGRRGPYKLKVCA